MTNRAKVGAGLPAIKELYDDVQVCRSNPNLYDIAKRIMTDEKGVKLRAHVKHNYVVLLAIYDEIKHVFWIKEMLTQKNC